MVNYLKSSKTTTDIVSIFLFLKNCYGWSENAFLKFCKFSRYTATRVDENNSENSVIVA